MSGISAEHVLVQLNWRYAVKRFDATRKITPETWAALEQTLVLTPSSYGLQPWRFIVVISDEVKSRLPEISWNQKQPQDCSHMVVLAARRTMDSEYVQHFMRSVTETRKLPAEAMDGYKKMLVSTVESMETHLDWNSRQVYIALGQLMVSAAMLGIDTCPMEGIDPIAYDDLLGLAGTDYTSVVGCACGFRHPDDKQADAAKVRFSLDTLVQHI